MYLSFTLLLSIVLVWEYVGISALRKGEKPKQKRHKKLKSLDLSPWELFVLNDIMIEISLSKCPSMKTPAARGLKSFVADSVKNADFKETMNPDFWPTYNNLVQCMGHLDEGGKNGGQVMRSAAAVLKEKENENDPRKKSIKAKSEENTGDKKGWRSNAWEQIPGKSAGEDKLTSEEAVKIYLNGHASNTAETIVDPPTATDESEVEAAKLEKVVAGPKTNPIYPSNNNNGGTLESMNDMMSKMKNWLPSFMGGGGGMSEMGGMSGMGGMSDMGGMPGLGGMGRFKRSKSHPATEKAEDESNSDAHQKFQRMFLTIHQILRKSCPVELRPSGHFSVQLIREFLAWISKDTQAFSEASIKFFDKDMLIQEAQKCLLAL